MRCPACNGNGFRYGDRTTDEDCYQCNGSGEACRQCGGSAPNGHDLCEDCRPTKSSDPIYTLRHAFEAEPICSVFGFDGLRETLPQLERGLYMIRDDWAEVGVAEHHRPGDWRIDMYNGVKAGPGYIIV